VAGAAGVSPLLFDEPLVSGRIVLSNLTSGTLATMPWIEAALAPEWTLADLEAVVGDGKGILLSDVEGVAIGVAVLLRDVPAAGDATLPFIAVDPERRFRGLGGEAGLALAAHLRNHGVSRVYAPVPDGRGLALYFWLRLGFRPLLQGESPGMLAGLNAEPVRGVWMLQDQP
jgi:GNAT superfamily N-acetyltransferase